MESASSAVAASPTRRPICSANLRGWRSKTSRIDYNGRFCMSSAAAASIKAFGIDRGLPFPLADIANAETILLVGSNIAETMPPVMQYFEEQKKRGGSLIVVDPRLTPTAAAATLHLQITPGTDATLANGLLNIAIKAGYTDDALHRRAHARFRTSRAERLFPSGRSAWSESRESMRHRLRRAADLLGRAKTAIILTARGRRAAKPGSE